MKIRVLASVLVLLACIAPTASTAAADESVFESLLEEYEVIRLELLHDSTAHVAHRAEAIRMHAEDLAGDFDAARAGVNAGDAAACKQLLPEISAAAEQLASAQDLASAREAFFALSKPMGRYRKLAGIEGSMVVYCSMEKKAWIQPLGDIGNPYGGQMMPMCGQVIAD